MTSIKKKKLSPAIAAIATPFGKMILAAGPKGIFKASGGRVKVLRGHKMGLDRVQVNALSKAVKELREYCLGKRERFTVRLDLSKGTKFQQKVWTELRKIPFGETVTYGEIARRIGRPSGARAVGQAVGSNPIGIIIPCHRVIASGGKPGGWSGGGGIAGKLALLSFEGAEIIKKKLKRKGKGKR